MWALEKRREEKKAAPLDHKGSRSSFGKPVRPVNSWKVPFGISYLTFNYIQPNPLAKPIPNFGLRQVSIRKIFRCYNCINNMITTMMISHTHYALLVTRYM